ncbi:TIGR03617 family F420-dependent LLM class oxidoreductase [Acidimicrobiaceae bacterium USS-CC1]|uniref:TIGR03617 family F420-dependent LLM class oxidoreductase n=1 Tax=Acidiferrimicrobium australe TaxID=2664430 RepID=A0ABW9QT91_9ACTN|nr:TIGR03617 family F420-dependent LLM class oxidoreductase [Acidiferrimicrobium australe]
MLVDGGIPPDLAGAADGARRAEEEGYAAVWGSETSHDPFLPLALAAEHTTRLELGTGIAVAFARNPMTVASTAWDLNAYSRGRFLLGLGSQIKPHIEKRFSMRWSHPAPRMREFVSAMRAIWACWQDGTPLQFRGEYYRHTLMTPFFSPPPNQYGAPRVFLAAVGPAMTRVAGEVADGLLVHGFTTARYLREVTLPAVEAGLAASGRSRAAFQLSYPIFVVTGDTDEQLAEAASGTRKQLAFYASTPAYRAVLDLHGWGEMQPALNALSKQGRWDDMADLIPQEVLDAFAVVGEPDEVPALITERVGELVDRVSLYTPYPVADDVVARVRGGLLAG